MSADQRKAQDDALYLALDYGSHAARALVFDSQGHVQARALTKIGTINPRIGWT